MSKQDIAQINQFLMELVSVLVALIEQKDAFMKGHAERVALLCKEFTASLSLTERKGLDKIYFAGLLHDIGMVYLPLDLVQNPERLSDQEMAQVRCHPDTAAAILANLSLFNDIIPMIRHHHEHWDGTGYPDGLAKTAIPLGAQILAMAEAFDALTSQRPHRPPLSTYEAYRQISEAGGSQFNPKLVKRFIRFLQARATESAISPTAEEAGRTISRLVDEVITDFRKGKIEMPVLPQVLADIRKVLANERYTGTQLAETIEKDATISVRLIAVANSPYYRGIEQVTSVREAVSRMGYKEAQNIASSIAQRSLFETKNLQIKKLLEKLWLHSLACGYAASEIARNLGLSNTDENFFMGTVHDIGKAVLLTSLARKISPKTSIRMPDLEGPLSKTAGMFTAEMLRRWNYAKNLLRAVAHHEMEDLMIDASTDMRVLNLANHIVRKAGYTVFSKAPEEMILAQMPSARMLNLQAEQIEAVTGTVKEFIGQAAPLF